MAKKCMTCYGSGKERQMCVACAGKGTVKFHRGKDRRGVPIIDEQTCVPCKGEGWTHPRCSTCGGTGKVD